MAEKNEPRVLIVDVDAEAAQRMGVALDSAGITVAWCSFSPTDFTETFREFNPTMLLVHAEPGSPQLATLLARLDAAGAPGIPVTLLCRDTADEAFVRPLKTGIVEMLTEPFNPRVHVGRLRFALAELPDRPGKLRGRGQPNEINQLLQHLMRARRTGGLVIAEGTSDEARAFFVRGVLKSARFGQHTMQQALGLMSRLQTTWTFTEGAGGNAGVVDFDEAEGGDPFNVTYREATAPVLVATGEMQVPVTPVSPAAPAPAARPASPAIDLESARTTILFVDDDPAVVTMLADYFTKKGYPVTTARDGVEALNLMVNQQYEVVIADLNMPRLDGWGLLRMIREDLRTHETPVALFSAQDNYRDSLRLLHAGAQAYFPKTLKLSALEAQVKELAEPRRRFLRTVPGGLTYAFSALGAQWTLRALDRLKFSGQLDARDAWGLWRLWFEGGRLAQANAKMGNITLASDRALSSFLSSKSSEGSLSTDGRAPDEGFAMQSTESTLSRLVPWMNDEQKRTREDQLVKAKSLIVHDDLYRLYVTVGPPAWLPIARLLCEQKLAPAEVIARLQCTPVEVASVVKDLIRRGVVTLQS